MIIKYKQEEIAVIFLELSCWDFSEQRQKLNCIWKRWKRYIQTINRDGKDGRLTAFINYVYCCFQINDQNPTPLTLVSLTRAPGLKIAENGKHFNLLLTSLQFVKKNIRTSIYNNHVQMAQSAGAVDYIVCPRYNSKLCDGKA